MALLPTGKRKRREELSDQTSHPLGESSQTSRSPKNHNDDEKLQALFREHFEARFAPLEVGTSLPPSRRNDDERANVKKRADDEFESESEVGWGGISDEEGEKKIAASVIEYQDTEARTGEKVLQGEFKSFMVCMGHLA